MSDLETYRQLLNVTKSSSRADIKKAYRKLAKQWHPDRFYQDPKKHKIAEEKFKQITVAYEHLIENNNQDDAVSQAKTSTHSTSVNTEKTDPQSYYRLGLSLAERGELEESLEFFGQAIKLDPEYLEALEYRYKVLSELGFEYRAAADSSKIRDLKQKAQRNKTAQSSSAKSQSKNSKSLFKLLKRFRSASSSIKFIAVDHRRKLIPITNQATVQIIQLGSYQVTGELDLHTKPILHLDLHPKYNWLVTAGDNEIVQVFDLDENKSIGQLKKSLFAKKYPKTTRVYFIPEQNCALLISAEGAIRKWNYEKNKVLYEKNHSIKIQSTAINSRRTKIALFDNRKTIRIHEASTGELLHTLRFRSTATTIALSSAGNLLAIATLNKQVEIWNIAKKVLLCQFTRNPSQIIFLQFVNSQKHLLTVGKDGTIRISSLNSKQQTLTQITHLQGITTCKLIDKERTLVLGTAQGEIILCRLPALT